MEQATVCARSDLIDDIRLEIHVERTRDMLSRRGLREESGETIIVLRWGSLNETTVGLYGGQSLMLKQ